MKQDELFRLHPERQHPKPGAGLRGGLGPGPPREIKNPWGWTGFTRQEIKRSTLMARPIALIYNGWP